MLSKCYVLLLLAVLHFITLIIITTITVCWTREKQMEEVTIKMTDFDLIKVRKYTLLC